MPTVAEQFAALEMRIEEAWVALTTMRYNRPRTYYLSPTGLLVYDSRGGDVATAIEIGTFTRTEDLQHFREAVFFVWNEMHGGRNGG